MQRQKVCFFFLGGADLAGAGEDHLFHLLSPPNRGLTHMLNYQEQQQVQTPAGPANYHRPPQEEGFGLTPGQR